MQYANPMLPTYAINVRSRPDRLLNIRNEFKHRLEFDLTVITVPLSKDGARGLWQNLIKTVKIAQKKELEYFILCEDDHQFTRSYTVKKLQYYIQQAQNMNADVLLGGVSWYRSSIAATQCLFWVDKFNGLQFTVIYKKFYNALLTAEFRPGDAADLKISALTNDKFVIYPFISTQREFGYSDVTPHNNRSGYVNQLFKKSAQMLRQMRIVDKFYQSIPKTDSAIESELINSIIIPTYIISLSEQSEHLSHIKQQFAHRHEFETTIIEASKYAFGIMGLWNGIIEVIKLAIKNDDDVIIICRDNHEFTADYSKQFLIRNIIEAHEQGADILSGGEEGFGYIYPLTDERYWVNPVLSTQFIVLYKKIFGRILAHKFKNNQTVEGVFSELTSNKMLLYPFISVQRHFDDRDNTEFPDERKQSAINMFNKTAERMEKVKQAYLQYNTN